MEHPTGRHTLVAAVNRRASRQRHLILETEQRVGPRPAFRLGLLCRRFVTGSGFHRPWLCQILFSRRPLSTHRIDRRRNSDRSWLEHLVPPNATYRSLCSHRFRPRPNRAVNISLLATVPSLRRRHHTLLRGIGAKPKFLDAALQLGLPLAKAGRLNDAIQHFETALQLNPDYVPAHMNHAVSLAAQGKVSEANDELQLAIKMKPDDADVHYNLGNVLAQTGHLQESIQQYKEAVRLRPTFAEAHNNLSTVLYQDGQSMEAIFHSKQALELNPEYTEALSNLANAELQLGNIEQAVAHYREAIQSKPDLYEANFNLGAVLLKTGRPQESVKYFEQALRSKPDDLDASVSLLSAYTRTNQRPQAVALATRTLKLARSSGQTALVNKIEAWLSKYGGDYSPDSSGH